MRDGVVYGTQGYVNIAFNAVVLCPQYVDPEFQAYYQPIKAVTAMGIECLWTIHRMAKQCRLLPGDFAECGVFRGGSAAIIAGTMEGSGKTLHLFDTFAGMPEADAERDFHEAGDFADTDIASVRAVVRHESTVEFYAGRVPETFAGLEYHGFAFAHLDMDIYQSTMDGLEFFYQRMPVGGVILVDDYGHPSCPGVREAVDEYFADKRSVPLSSTTGQALVVKI